MGGRFGVLFPFNSISVIFYPMGFQTRNNIFRSRKCLASWMLWKQSYAPQSWPAAARSTSSQSAVKQSTIYMYIISRHSMRPNYLTKPAHVCMPRLLYISWKNNNNKTIYKHLCRGVYSFRLSVRPCVCSYVRGIYHKFFTELRNSFSSGVYLMNQSSESIHIWTIVSWRIGFHSMTPDPRIHAPEWARGQNLGHL